MLVSIQSRLTTVLAYIWTYIWADIRATSCLIGMVALALPVASFAQSSDQGSVNLPAGISAIVNGRPIPTEMIDSVESQLNKDEAPTSREDILIELIDLELLTQRAELQKLDAQPRVAARLQLQYGQTMANAYLESLSKELVISNDEVRAEYDKQIQLISRPEYRASHILIDTKAEATKAIAALDAGGNFAQIAEEFSTGPSAAKGGDLGWFDDDTMTAGFTAAVAKLSINEYTKTPVQTQFGWHVIQLRDKRSGSMPAFNTVKSGIRNLMIQNLLQERIAALREQAEIKTAQ